MKKLFLYSLTILFIWLSDALFAHSVQVAYGYGCGGSLRLYVEHWHSTENPASTTMTLELTVGATVTNITGSPQGSLQNTPLASLPTPATPFASCSGQANTYNDWVYYDFTVPCGVPISIKVISGNTVFTEDGCSMYPATITGIIIPCDAPIAIPSQTVCAGTNFAPTTFPVITGNTYTWTNNNTAIGLPASGSGNIGSFTATNSPTLQTSTITLFVNGCSDTTFTLTVNPQPVIVVTDPPAVCAPNTVDITPAAVTVGSTNLGPLTYWTNSAATNSLTNPSSISNSATYYIQSINTYGCSDIEPVTVIINPLPILAITNPPAVCTPNTVDITAAAITAGTTGTGTLSYWNDAAATSSLTNPNAITTSGIYYIQITTPAGCKDIKAVVVTIDQLPVLTITNPPAVCTPNTVDITSAAITAGSTGGGTLSYWMDAGATTSLSSPTAINASGTYYIQAMGNGGCKDIEPVVVTINPKPSLVINNPPPVCFPGTIDITLPAITNGTNGIGTLTYWNNATGTTTLANPNSITTSGTYYIQITSTAGCSDIQPVVVTVNPLPVLNITNPTTVCFPATVDITAPSITIGSIGTGTLTYWMDSTASIPLNNPGTVNYTGTYYIMLTNSSGCYDIQPVSITINAKPVAAFSVDIPKGCPVHCVNFTDLSTIVASNTISSWSWNFGDGQTSTQQNPANCYSNAGFYDVSLIVTSNRGCSDSLTMPAMIEVYPSPIAGFDATPDQATVLNPVITFINQSSSDVVYWEWDFGDSTTLGNTITPNPTHKYSEDVDQTYIVQLIVENSYGCRDTIAKPIEIGPEFTFFIPNAFTPNGDGINDDFFGQGIGITDYNIWIYDRWGNMIFHGSEITDKWDGRANYGADVAQQDVYIWKVVLKDVFKKKHNYMGTVTLIR